MALRLNRGLNIIGGQGMRRGRTSKSEFQKLAGGNTGGYSSGSGAKSFYSRKGGNSRSQYGKIDVAKGYGGSGYQNARSTARQSDHDTYNPRRVAAQERVRMREMKERSAFNQLPEDYASIAGTTAGKRAYTQRRTKREGPAPKPRPTGSGPAFTDTGSQGLNKLRYMESRGVKPSEQLRRNALGTDMRRNFAEQGGMSRVGVSALRGAAVGGVAGGTVESMQGGDFWDGAKSGAFYGATGMAGVRATRQAVGAQSYLGKNGIMGTMKMNKEQYGVGVKDLMLNQQNVGRAKDMMNSTNKKKK